MGMTRRIATVAAGTAGVAAAGTAVGLVASRRRGINRRHSDGSRLGSLHTPPRTVVADDGLPLHVEVEEPDEARPGSPTLVFVHGYTLNLDCWHFQRAAVRGRVRSVFYDQRSHGRSPVSSMANATIDQLGRDLGSVIEAEAPEGPVVLVGHSMGGMTIVALAEQHPELFGPREQGGRVAGVALISTTAGGLDPSRLFFPMVPTRVGSGLAHSAVRALARGHKAVDGVRRIGRSIAVVLTDVFAFGDDVPEEYVEFLDDIIAATPFEVVAQFFPGFRDMDKFESVEVLSQVPTIILCGTADRLTSVGHSRKLRSRIEGATLVEYDGAGHMVILERHEQVNDELEKLLVAAQAHWA